jgi:arylsulfatase A-like enzyme
VSWHREGGNIVKTPFLESLARSGTMLDNYYIYRFCSPSRSTFQ